MYHSSSEVWHVVRESMRWAALRALERRRSSLYAGIGAGPNSAALLRALVVFKSGKELGLARQILARAVGTGERAHKRGLAQEVPCPYCVGRTEDEEHIFWTCKRREETRETWRPRVEELAAAVLELGGSCWQS